jgi:hypothetical protein
MCLQSQPQKNIITTSVRFKPLLKLAIFKMVLTILVLLLYIPCRSSLYYLLVFNYTFTHLNLICQIYSLVHFT